MRHDESGKFESDTDADRDLDQLIRWSLRDEISDEMPPDRVWQHIQASLDGGLLAFPEKREEEGGWSFLPRLASVAVAFCLVFAVVLTMEVSFSAPGLEGQAYWMPAQAAPVVVSDEDVPSGRLAFIAEQEQRHLQRSLSPETDPLLVYRHWRG